MNKQTQKIIKTSSTFKKHYVATESKSYALCGVTVYPHLAGDEKYTTGLCKTCVRLAEKQRHA